MGLFDNNIAHSNGRYGLRIFVYDPRTDPCGVEVDGGLSDPYSTDPRLQATFSNLTTFKN